MKTTKKAVRKAAGSREKSRAAEAKQTTAAIAVRVEKGDVFKSGGPEDVLVLKYAQQRFGADRAAAKLFRVVGQSFPEPGVGKVSALVENPDGISAGQTVVVGTSPHWDFQYKDVRQVSELSLFKLAESARHVRHVVMTPHGVGFGLDPVRAFDAALAGLQSAVSAQRFPPSLRRVSFVTLGGAHFDILRSRLRELLPEGLIKARVPRVAMPKEAPPEVLVAMPFVPDGVMRPIFDSIAKGVHSVRVAKLTCGTVTDTGPSKGPGESKIQRIHRSIESATYVIADITPDDRYGCSNPNVCHEVGYAWAKGKDTVLIARIGAGEGAASNFDGVIRDIKYDGLKDLERQVRKVLTDKENERR